MDGIHHSRPLAAAIGLGLMLLAGLSGCAKDKEDGSSIWPWSSKKPDNLGILSPSEEIAGLRKMAEGAPQATPEQRERRSKLLATAIQKEGDPVIRAEIVRTLEKFATPTAAAVIDTARRDPESDVRIVVCEVLGRRGDSTAVAALGELLTSDVNVDVRLAAARALGQSHDPAAIAALGSVLEDPNPAMQYRAVQSLQTATGRDLGPDVNRWRQFVRGETPNPPPTMAERIRQMF